jgi:hypothetical protein
LRTWCSDRCAKNETAYEQAIVKFEGKLKYLKMNVGATMSMLATIMLA